VAQLIVDGEDELVSVDVIGGAAAQVRRAHPPAWPLN
jgi:hypothetical protein